MSRLYDLKRRIDQVVAERGLDAVRVKGAISLKAGMLIGLIGESTPDDEGKIRRLQQAAAEVIGEKI
jgi:hypothetical protein